MEEQIQHNASESFDIDSKWCVPCTCGERFTAPSPTGARAKWQKHADAKNKTARPADTTGPGTTPARAKHCGCGCGDPLAARAGGLFRSGHDARFKSILTAAHAEGRQVAHPLTCDDQPALDIADWLDERRGSGSFWRDKVLKGHKPQPERQARVSVAPEDKTQRAIQRVDSLMDALATRRPTSGDIGVVTLKSKLSYGARVIRRNTEDSLEVIFLNGPSCNERVIVPDFRFEKAKKNTDVRV